MPLVNMRSLLKAAEAGGWAVGSFSVANMECIRGVIRAAEELRAPVMLQIAEVRLPYSPLSLMGPMMIAAAKEATVPVGVHLDHGKDPNVIRQALELGFTSVMCDGSDLPIEENLRFTGQTVLLAYGRGAAVEAEVGRVGRDEDGTEATSQIATLSECFCMDAKRIDALAVGIGNAHGLYAAAPKLHYEVLEGLKGRMHASLVLHGGTGLTDEQFRTVIALGIRKINVATDVFMAQAGACKSNDVFRNIADSVDAVSAVVKRYIKLFGSEGKA